jgi:hypothetical protein
VWVKADFTMGKFWRDYHSPSTSLSWNWYAGLQINDPVFATLSSVTSIFSTSIAVHGADFPHKKMEFVFSDE